MARHRVSKRRQAIGRRMENSSRTGPSGLKRELMSGCRRSTEVKTQWRLRERCRNERRPRFSPDTRFVAYESDETGTNEIFVQPFRPTGGKWQISVGGGSDVAWRGD